MFFFVFSEVMDLLMSFLVFTTAALILIFAQKTFYLINVFLGPFLTALSCDRFLKTFM